MSGEGADLSSESNVPQLERLAGAAGHCGATLRRESDRSDGIEMLGEGTDLSSGSNVPSLSVLSELPDSAARPSGANATEVTISECPVKVRISRPVATSHSFSVLS